MSRFSRPSLFLTLSSALFLSAPANAASVLLDIDGPLGGGALLGDPSVYVAAAATFTPRVDVLNASLGMTIYCGSCSGEVWLVASPPGPDVPASALRALERFVGPEGRTIAYDLSDIIRGMTLAAGITYTMILEITSGEGAWYSTPEPVFDDRYIRPDEGYVSRDARLFYRIGLPFEPLESRGYTPLTYTIRGDLAPAPVPIPASLPLSLLGLGALIAARRRKTG